MSSLGHRKYIRQYNPAVGAVFADIVPACPDGHIRKVRWVYVDDASVAGTAALAIIAITDPAAFGGTPQTIRQANTPIGGIAEVMHASAYYDQPIILYPGESLQVACGTAGQAAASYKDEPLNWEETNI